MGIMSSWIIEWEEAQADLELQPDCSRPGEMETTKQKYC